MSELSPRSFACQDQKCTAGFPSQLRNTNRHCDERNEETISTGRDGYASLEMLLSFHESERTGNNRVDFPMQNKDISVLVRERDFISNAVPAT